LSPRENFTHYFEPPRAYTFIPIYKKKEKKKKINISIIGISVSVLRRLPE
jgi:hypothetical protein